MLFLSVIAIGWENHRPIAALALLTIAAVGISVIRSCGNRFTSGKRNPNRFTLNATPGSVHTQKVTLNVDT